MLAVGWVSAINKGPSSWFSKFLFFLSQGTWGTWCDLIWNFQTPRERLVSFCQELRQLDFGSLRPTDLATQNGKENLCQKKGVAFRRLGVLCVCVCFLRQMYIAIDWLLVLYHQHPIGCFCFERLICRLCIALRASISGPSRAQDLVQSGTCWVVRVASNIILPDPPRSASFPGQYSIYPFCISFIKVSFHRFHSACTSYTLRAFAFCRIRLLCSYTKIDKTRPRTPLSTAAAAARSACNASVTDPSCFLNMEML